VYTPFELAKIIYQNFNFDESLISPVTKEQFPEVAIRPENSVLNIQKAVTDINYAPTPLRSSLRIVF
jgi:dTDP-4-dehydrorhamnose reductase